MQQDGGTRRKIDLFFPARLMDESERSCNAEKLKGEKLLQLRLCFALGSVTYSR